MTNIKFTIIVMFYSILLVQTENEKLKGKYKMEYDNGYEVQNGIIDFDKKTYTRNQNNGKKIKGEIDYQKHFVFLNDKNSQLQVKFAKREIGNDTIYFRTIDLNDKVINQNSLTIYASKLIKIK